MGPSANAPQVARRGIVSAVVHGRRRIAGRVGPRPTAGDAEDFGRQGRPKSIMALILDGFHRRFRAETHIFAPGPSPRRCAVENAEFKGRICRVLAPRPRGQSAESGHVDPQTVGVAFLGAYRAKSAYPPP